MTIPLAGCAMGGALHQASIVGTCAQDDAACSRRHPQAPLAIGARFHPVTLLRDGSPERRRIRAHVPGKATITVALGESHASFDVAVLP